MAEPTHALAPETIRLFLAVRDGEASRWDELYAHFSRRIRSRLVLRHGLDPKDEPALDDLVQDAMTGIFRTIDRFEYRSEAGFYAWVYRRVEWTVKDRWRKKCEAGFGDYDLSSSIFSAEGDSPSEELGAEEERERLEQAVRERLEGLRPKSREIFLLRQYEGLSYPEIAREMDITESDAKVTNFRTLKTLREHLERCLGLGPKAEEGA